MLPASIFHLNIYTLFILAAWIARACLCTECFIQFITPRYTFIHECQMVTTSYKCLTTVATLLIYMPGMVLTYIYEHVRSTLTYPGIARYEGVYNISIRRQPTSRSFPEPNSVALELINADLEKCSGVGIHTRPDSAPHLRLPDIFGSCGSHTFRPYYPFLR